ncbi:MAG: glycerophosphodiester phosphodiesterase [Haloarculaceae archaeon]
MQCIAHRGFAEAYPENTIAAVRGATRSGADAIEVDVRRSGSGDLVVCHDATVERVTDRTGAVADLSAEHLAGLDVLGSGEGVPTLDAVVAELPEDIGLNVEVKERGLVADVHETLAGLEEWWLSSFDSEALAAARRAWSPTAGGRDSVPTALLVGPDAEDPIGTAVGLACRALHPHVDLCTPEFVGAAHDAGLAVNAWTVRSERTARGLVDAGVDGVIADAPAWCPGDH